MKPMAPFTALALALLVGFAPGTATAQCPSGTCWDVTGNAGTSPANGNFLGTTDNAPFEVWVNNMRALRLEPHLDEFAFGRAPNVIAGSPANSVDPRFYGMTIAGGGSDYYPNQVGDSLGAIGGGHNNRVVRFAGTVGGGFGNVAGNFGTVPGGYENEATGFASFAVGYKAKALHAGSVVFKDQSDADFPTDNTDAFFFKFQHGGVIWTHRNLSSGVFIPGGGSQWFSVSDRAAKRDFVAVDHRALVAKLAAMPIDSWSYKSEDPSMRHIGPVAQDFYAAFGIGVDDKHIGTLDEAGVALAAIKGLHQIVRDKDAEIARLQSSVEALSARLANVETLLAKPMR